MNQTLPDVISWRRRAPLKADLATSVQVAAEAMNAERAGAILAMRGDIVAGIVTERDILGRVVANGVASGEITLEEIMTVNLTCVAPDTTVGSALAIMAQLKVRHLLVTEGGPLLGVVSMRDLTAWLAREHDDEIADLVRYVAGPAVHLRA